MTSLPSRNPKRPTSATEAGTSGSQTVQRAVAILRRVAEGGSDGRRVVDIAQEAGLHVATTQRLMATLAREGLLHQIADTKRYRVGPEVLALAAYVRRSMSMESMLDGALKRLAQRTGDTVFLMVRSGYSGICLAREEGTFPIKTMTLDIGSRRPLGVGAGALALLAFSPAYEAEEAIAANAGDYQAFATTATKVQTLVEQTRRLGYALNDEDVVRRVKSVALPVASTSGRIVAAVTVAAIAERMDARRRAQIVQMIREEISLLPDIPD